MIGDFGKGPTLIKSISESDLNLGKKNNFSPKKFSTNPGKNYCMEFMNSLNESIYSIKVGPCFQCVGYNDMISKEQLSISVSKPTIVSHDRLSYDFCSSMSEYFVWNEPVTTVVYLVSKIDNDESVANFALSDFGIGYLSLQTANNFKTIRKRN